MSRHKSEYSISERGVEEDILPTCRENGIAFVPYCPLGRGFLTGNIRSLDSLPPNDRRREDPRFSAENLPHNLRILDAVTMVAARHGVTNARVSLAWLLAQGQDVVPIPGVKRRETMRDSAESPNLTLTTDDLWAIEEAAPVGATYGLPKLAQVRL